MQIKRSGQNMQVKLERFLATSCEPMPPLQESEVGELGDLDDEPMVKKSRHEGTNVHDKETSNKAIVEDTIEMDEEEEDLALLQIGYYTFESIVDFYFYIELLQLIFSIDHVMFLVQIL